MNFKKQAIEYYEVQKNDRFLIFQNKLSRLFANPKISLALSQNNKISEQQSNKNYLVAKKLTEIQQQVQKQLNVKNESDQLFEKAKKVECNVKEELSKQETKIQLRIVQLKERKKQRLMTMSEQGSVVSFGASSSNNPESPELNDFKKTQKLEVISKKLKKLLNFTSSNQCISETVSEEEENSKEIIEKVEINEENKKKSILMFKKASQELDGIISKFLAKKQFTLIKPVKKFSFVENVEKLNVKQSSNSIHIKYKGDQNKNEKNQFTSLISLNNNNRSKLANSNGQNKKEEEEENKTQMNNNCEFQEQIIKINSKFDNQMKVLKGKIENSEGSTEFYEKLLLKLENDKKCELEAFLVPPSSQQTIN